MLLLELVVFYHTLASEHVQAFNGCGRYNEVSLAVNPTLHQSAILIGSTLPPHLDESIVSYCTPQESENT
jgi:hypothetical protein